MGVADWGLRSFQEGLGDGKCGFSRAADFQCHGGSGVGAAGGDFGNLAGTAGWDGVLRGFSESGGAWNAVLEVCDRGLFLAFWILCRETPADHHRGKLPGDWTDFYDTGSVSSLCRDSQLAARTRIALTLGFFVALSAVGRREGIHFGSNRWIWLGFTGVLLSASSGLYDRYLLAHYGFSPATFRLVFDLSVSFHAPACLWLVAGLVDRFHVSLAREHSLTGLTLIATDFFYFRALAEPDAMVSIVACLRRGSILVTFFAGTLIFKEKLFLSKLPCVLGILVGIVLILTSGG